MPRKRRFIFVILCTLFVLAASLAFWIKWGHWPDPKQRPVFSDADAIVVLGGGDGARWRQGLVMATAHSEIPVVVTGDGGLCVDQLVADGLPVARILHEEAATSTVENAQFTKPLLDEIGAKRVILVTNWFHAPRALAVFRREQPFREFCVSFEKKREPLPVWDRNYQRRERMASVLYLLRYGIWSW